MKKAMKILVILTFFAMATVSVVPMKTLCEESNDTKVFTVTQNVERLKEAKNRMRAMVRKYGKTLGGIFGEEGTEGLKDEKLLELT